MLTKLALPCLRGAGLLHPALVPARASCACLIDVPTATALVGAAADTATTALVAAADATVSLDDLGSDIFIFLAASVLVVPASRVLNVTPVLGFLALGCGIGPYGLGLFGNSEADLQLGDLGIVFLLFIEGLQLSPDRLKKLGSFFKLGLAQFLLTIAAITAANLYLGPQILPFAERFIPLDDSIVRPILTTPVLAFCLAGAGALSSSAFVLPELKAKGWDERAEGTAALTVLLLQDIAVAPLLVILPLLAGSGPQSGPELGILVAKGTFGFGLVLAAGSVILRQIFAIVAATQSSETFVAAALLVAIGMGVAAEDLGLSTTTGAFAAGVLLAGSQYRQQIEADIKPFEGILLGIFFMTAGANLDPALCLQEWPTLLSGILAFLGAKLLILFAAGAFAFGLTRAEAIRIALLLAGGGEFAFVVFKLAEDLGLLPDRLEKLLTASVIISMSLTPLLAELAVYVGDVVERIDASGGLFGEVTCGIDDPQADALFDVIDADGSGSIDADELRTYLLGGGTAAATRDNASFETLFKTIDLNGDGVISRDELRKGYLDLVTGELEVLTEAGQSSDEASAELATAPDAVVVCGYGEMGQRACDVLADVEGIKSVESAVDTADYKERYTRSTTPTAEVNPMMAGLQNMMGGGAVPAAAGASEPSALVAQPPLVAERDELSTQFIAFDRNPSRVALGQDNRARVVYGDGASPVLLKAAGVDQPRAIVVTYANDKRVLEATRRLRDAYPDAPIYARGRTALDAESLLQAGATEVVVESVEAAVRFATLLGAPAEAADKLLRAPLTAESLLGDSATAAIDGNFGLRQAYGGLFGEAAAAAPPPYVAEQFGDLANECGTTVEAVRQLYGGFAALEANDDGEVELFAIRPMLVRTNDGPLDDATLQAWMAGSGLSRLSFFDYVRLDAHLAAKRTAE